jgi:hypothetical protein
MQEAPPSTPSADRPRRRRFINLLTAILLLFTIGTSLMVVDLFNSYLWTGEGEETSWGRGILMISTWAFVILKFCIPALFRYWSNAEIERLLPEFIQVSDRFTRPKHYIHKALIGNAATGYADSFIRQLGAYSDGSLQTPALTDRDGKTGHITYKVIISINDKIFPILVSDKLFKNNEYSYQKMSDVAREAQRDGINVIHVRVVTDPDTTCEQTDDISLEGVRLEAFIKTLELSGHFRINPTAW